MITKAKKQKAKSEKAKKQKGGKRKSEKPKKKKGRLESRDANPHSKTEKITVGGRRTPIVSK